MNDARPDRRARRLARIVAWQVGVVIAGLALVEIGMRLYLRIGGEPYNRAAARGEVARLASLNQDFVPRPNAAKELSPPDNPGAERSLHPYVGWEIADGYRILANEYQWTRSPDSRHALTVLVLGGSVADIFDQEEYGIGPLRRLLKSDPRLADREIHFLKFGRGGFKQPQQVNYLVFLLSLGFRIDVVIELDGFNEVALGNNNLHEGAHPAYPSAAHWAQLASWGTSDRTALDMVAEIRETQHAIDDGCTRFASWQLDRSCIVCKLALARMRTLRSRLETQFRAYAKYLGERPSPASSLGLQGGEEAAIEASVLDWAECSRTESDICRARGILYLHFLQPTLHDKGSKTLTPKEIAQGGMLETWLHGVEIGYPMLRAKGEELKKLGVNFIDLSLIFKDRTGDIYFDACHFATEGNEILARNIARELLARLPAK